MRRKLSRSCRPDNRVSIRNHSGTEGALSAHPELVEGWARFKSHSYFDKFNMSGFINIDGKHLNSYLYSLLYSQPYGYYI